MSLGPNEILINQNRFAYYNDEQAYKKLFYHFHPLLFRFSYHLTLNAQASEEIVSDVMMKIWQMGPRLAQVEKLNTYLFSAIRNSSLTYLSSRKTAPENVEYLHDCKVEWYNPEQQMNFSELEHSVESTIRTLPAKCQMVYRLIREEGFCYKEVCTILQISQNTAETHMRLALKKIKTCLQGYLNEGNA